MPNTAEPPKAVPLVSFNKSFPNLLIKSILRFCETRTLAKCLAVSEFFFSEAGKILYDHIIITGSESSVRFLEGADIVEIGPLQKGVKRRPNFKRPLLEKVRIITIRTHSCPLHDDLVMGIRQAVGMMNNLERTILWPDGQNSVTTGLCRKRICPIIAGLECHTVTVGNIESRGFPDSDGGPLDVSRPILQHVQHATLIIPPTVAYVDTHNRTPRLPRTHGDPSELALPTRHLQNVRLIVALPKPEIGSAKSILGRPVAIATLDNVQYFLARYLCLNPCQIEIYMFNDIEHDFSDSSDLDTFREQLRAKVDQCYQIRLANLNIPKDSDDHRLKWTPNYQVFDLEHYFARKPSISDELDGYMLLHWQMTLRYIRREKEKIVAAGKLALAVALAMNELTSLPRFRDVEMSDDETSRNNSRSTVPPENFLPDQSERQYTMRALSTALSECNSRDQAGTEPDLEEGNSSAWSRKGDGHRKRKWSSGGVENSCTQM